MNAMSEIILPCRLEGKFANAIIKEFYKTIKQNPKTILFDFSRVHSFDSFGLVIVTCLILRFMKSGITLEVKHPIEAEVRQQLKNIGFGKFFGLRGIEKADGKSTGLNSCIRLKTLMTRDQPFILEASDFLANWVKMSRGAYFWFYDALGEAVDNAMTHSSSEIAIACGIAYPHQKKVDICVGDIGIGIPVHLRKNSLYARIKSDKNALLKAVEYGITGTMGTGTETNAGIGLSHLQEIAIASSGEMRITSLQGMYYMAADRHKPIVKKLDGKVFGTIVSVRFGILPEDRLIVAKTKNGQIL